MQPVHPSDFEPDRPILLNPMLPESDLGDQRARPQAINVGSGDDGVTRIQLAARWAEAYAPPQGDTLNATLQRFRIAFDYLDAVTHGVEPASLDAPAAAEVSA